MSNKNKKPKPNEKQKLLDEISKILKNENPRLLYELETGNFSKASESGLVNVDSFNLNKKSKDSLKTILPEGKVVSIGEYSLYSGVTPVYVRNKKEPQENQNKIEETKKENEKRKKEIDKSVKKLESLSKKPFFKKSYLDLSQLSPFLDVSLIILQSEAVEIFKDIDSATKNRDELVLFDIPYNNIISFEYNPSENAESKLSIIDTTDLFFLSLYQWMIKTKHSSHVQIKVTFGWNDSNEPKIRNKKEGVFRSNSRVFVVTGCEMSVESGKTSFNMSLKTSVVWSDPWINIAFKPYNLLGKNPLLMLSLIKEITEIFKNSETLRTIDNSVLENEISKEKNYLQYLTKNKIKDKKLNDQDYERNEKIQKEILRFSELGYKESKDIASAISFLNTLKLDYALPDYPPTFYEYMKGSANLSVLKADFFNNFKQVPDSIALRFSDRRLSPLESFIFLCRKMIIHLETLSQNSVKKTKIAFMYLVPENLGYDDEINVSIRIPQSETKEEVVSKQQKTDLKKGIIINKRTLTKNSLNVIQGSDWLSLLQEAGNKVSLYSKRNEKIEEIANLSIQEINIIKTGDWKKNVEDILVFLEQLKDKVRVNAEIEINKENKKISEVDPVFENFIKKSTKEIKDFQNNESIDSLKILIIVPKYNDLKLSKDESKKEGSSDPGNALKEALEIKSGSPIIQTYTINPSKKIRTYILNNKDESLKNDNVFDVISFKPSITDFFTTTEMSSSIGSSLASNVSFGSKDLIDSSNPIAKETFGMFAPLNTMIKYPTQIISNVDNYSNIFSNIIDAKNKIVSEIVNNFARIKAELVILGEPSYSNTFFLQKNIFIKVYSQEDGMFSPYSGIYRITEIKHSIQSNKFLTTLQLIKNEVSNSFYFDNLSEEITLNEVIITEKTIEDSKEIEQKAEEKKLPTKKKPASKKTK